MPSADACAITVRLRENPDGTITITDPRGVSVIAHTQANRLAAMFPTPEPEPAVDPRTAAEDRCRTFWESCTSFEKATLRWLSGVDGWTDAKALDVRTREWRRAR